MSKRKQKKIQQSNEKKGNLFKWFAQGTHECILLQENLIGQWCLCKYV